MITEKPIDQDFGLNGRPAFSIFSVPLKNRQQSLLRKNFINKSIEGQWRLLFTKIESTLPNGNISTIEFNKYEKLGNGWIAPEVLFFNNQGLTMREEYYDISLSIEPRNLFKTDSFKTIKW